MSRAAVARARVAAAALAVLAAFLPAAPAAAEIEVPYLSGRVVDAAGMLGPDTADGLSTALADLESATGAQIVVLTLATLDGVPIEQYSVEVAETWGLGDAERDDGVLFLIVRDDRLMRIEVGYGLEPVIPDILAGRILDQVVRPRFREGDFDAGVISGVNAIAALIQGSAPAEVLPSAPPPRNRFGGCVSGLFWLALLFIFLSAMRRRGGMVFLPGGGGWSGSSGGGFSSGGGGFSGGGGSFGGGGASSSW